MKKIVSFLLVSVVLWFPFGFALAMMADALGLPNTEIWLWVLRACAALVASCISWVIIGGDGAKNISLAVLSVFSVILNYFYLACVVLGLVAVVMIFVRDWMWLYEHLYRPFLLGAATVALISLLPLALFLMVFRATRLLGAVAIQFLGGFFVFDLWFYSFMVCGQAGPGWVIAGFIPPVVGHIVGCITTLVMRGQWKMAGCILIALMLSLVAAGFLGPMVASKEVERFEKEKDDTIAES
ncbi:MAG: hypothetical protein HZA91_15470 [Verrucomicrobia bacterium]|nr:hypothetical protein [Verrucomicrobiota bacterium]